MHKNTKMLPYERREAYRRWRDGERATELAEKYGVSRTTLCRVFAKAKHGVFVNYSSKNLRYRTLEYGLSRLVKTEERIAKKLARRAHREKRYTKHRPGEMVHFDSSQLGLLAGEAGNTPREYLFIAIDDASRWLFADILPDQTSWSAAIHLDESIIMFPFEIGCAYSDNGKEYKGEFKRMCERLSIPQQFTQPYHPYTNGKAERVIKTIKHDLLKRIHPLNREERRRHLYAFVRWYNQVRPHQSFGNVSPMTFLEEYIARTKRELQELRYQQESVNNA
jgi:transposase InsO family protein